MDDIINYLNLYHPEPTPEDNCRDLILIAHHMDTIGNHDYARQMRLDALSEYGEDTFATLLDATYAQYDYTCPVYDKEPWTL